MYSAVIGRLEEASRIRKRKQDIQKAVLAAVAITGLLAWTAIAPNTLQLLRYVPKDKFRFLYRANSVARRLVIKGWAIWVEKDGKKSLRLTETGRRALALEQTKATLQNQKKKWDGRWRDVLYAIVDTIEHDKNLRRQFKLPEP